MQPFRFFKVNILGGFRLADLNMQLKQDEYFYLDIHKANISRSVQVALRDRWVLEISEKEARRHLTLPSFSEYFNTPKEETIIKGENQAVVSYETTSNKEAVKRVEKRIEKIKQIKNDSVKDVVNADVDKLLVNVEKQSPEIAERLKNRLKSIQHQKYISGVKKAQQEDEAMHLDAESTATKIRTRRLQVQKERLHRAEEQTQIIDEDMDIESSVFDDVSEDYKAKLTKKVKDKQAEKSKVIVSTLPFELVESVESAESKEVKPNVKKASKKRGRKKKSTATITTKKTGLSKRGRLKKVKQEE